MCMPCRAACNYCAVMYEERIHMHASIHPSTIHVCALRCASCCVVPLPYGLLFRLLVLADRDTPGSCFMHLSCTFRLVPAAQAQGWPGRPALAVRVLPPREPCVAHGRASCDMHASRSNEQLTSAVQCMRHPTRGNPRPPNGRASQLGIRFGDGCGPCIASPVCPLRPRQLLRSSDLSTCGPSAVSPLHTPRAHVHGPAQTLSCTAQERAPLGQ